MTNPMITCFLVLMAFVTHLQFCDSGGCSDTANNYNANETVTDSIRTIRVYIGYQDYFLDTHLKKEYQKGASVYEIRDSGCEQWDLPASAMHDLLKDMYQVDAEKWNQICYHYPCYYKGTVTNGDHSYDIHVNAGSFVSLYNDHETLYFVNHEASDHFLVPCNCCE